MYMYLSHVCVPVFDLIYAYIYICIYVLPGACLNNKTYLCIAHDDWDFENSVIAVTHIYPAWHRLE